MKYTIIAILIILPNLVSGQYKKYELGFSIGNNGMYKDVKDYYSEYNSQQYFFEYDESNATDLKYSLSVKYFISEKISARLEFGYIHLKGESEPDMSFFNVPEYKVNQSVYNFNPSICYSGNLDKFEITTGIEIPLMLVGDFEIKGPAEFDSLIYVYSPFNFTKTTHSGGFIWGISSFIGLKYYFNNWIGIGSEISYGLMFANVGDEIKREWNDGYDSYSEKYDGGFKKTYFSSPEISLGAFVKF